MANEKIVLVEDDKVLSDILHKELEEQGYSVEQAYDGHEGLDLITKIIPDLVILDILMPRKSGFQVLDVLKYAPATKHIPVIILSMLSKDDDLKRGLTSGASDFIVKSQHTVGEVVKKITEFIEDKSNFEVQEEKEKEE